VLVIHLKPRQMSISEDEAEGISNDEIKNAIKGMLESELSGKTAVIWPQNSKDR